MVFRNLIRLKRLCNSCINRIHAFTDYVFGRQNLNTFLLKYARNVRRTPKIRLSGNIKVENCISLSKMCQLVQNKYDRRSCGGSMSSTFPLRKMCLCIQILSLTKPHRLTHSLTHSPPSHSFSLCTSISQYVFPNKHWNIRKVVLVSA